MSKKKKHYKIKSYTPGNNCPTKKQGYKDRKTATKKMYQVIHGACHNGRLPIRVYKCKCGYWHLTSKPKRVKS